MTITLQNPRQIALELLYQPVTYLPFSESLIAEGREAYLQLMEICTPVAKQASHIRSGEIDPDLGLIRRRGESGSDYKDFFHYAHDLPRYLNSSIADVKLQAVPQLLILQRLYVALTELSICVAAAIDDCYGRHFVSALAPAVAEASKISRPYSTTTLRGLRYPAVPGQTGAKPHVDRSLFGIHCGDEGGNLCVEDREGQYAPVYIPSGMVVMFRGIKAYLLSRGKFAPVMHSSITEPGMERRAMVQFVQAETKGVNIFHAMEAYELLRSFKG